jgi:hypothetical protein
MSTADARAEIAELYSRYAWALNDRDWPAWEACFTPEAVIDNTTAGGVVGSRSDLSEFLATTLAGFELLINAVSNLTVGFDDDGNVTSRAMFTVTMKMAGPPPAYMVARGWYRDRLELAEQGWQIAERVETLVDVQAE